MGMSNVYRNARRDAVEASVAAGRAKHRALGRYIDERYREKMLDLARNAPASVRERYERETGNVA